MAPSIPHLPDSNADHQYRSNKRHRRRTNNITKRQVGVKQVPNDNRFFSTTLVHTSTWTTTMSQMTSGLSTQTVLVTQTVNPSVPTGIPGSPSVIRITNTVNVVTAIASTMVITSVFETPTRAASLAASGSTGVPNAAVIVIAVLAAVGTPLIILGVIITRMRRKRKAAKSAVDEAEFRRPGKASMMRYGL